MQGSGEMVLPASFDPRSLIVVVGRAPTPLLTGLKRLGARAEGVSGLPSPEDVPARAAAVVWLADESPALAVLACMLQLRSRRPGLRLVLVTSWPEELATLFVHLAGRASPSILRTANPPDVMAVLGARARPPEVRPTTE